jgi:4-amino-4-deoxy-L-arabinose transferase-like glycosyltransferase
VNLRSDPCVLVVSADFLAVILALFGLRRLWKKKRVFVVWLLVALGFLIIWPKWPQYVLILTAPVALAATEGARVLARERLTGWPARAESERPV